MSSRPVARRVPAEEFRALPLEVHALLADIPLQDVTAVDLPGGGAGRTLGDLQALITTSYRELGNPVVRALFALRSYLGRKLDWDRPQAEPDASVFGQRIPAALSARSRVPAGARHGPMHVLYELEHESLAEGRNATVHAFLAQALLPTGTGYRLYWAVYVRSVSWFTPVYMALIEPFRRYLVYPSLLSRVVLAWAERYAALGAPDNSGTARDAAGLPIPDGADGPTRTLDA